MPTVGGGGGGGGGDVEPPDEPPQADNDSVTIAAAKIRLIPFICCIPSIRSLAITATILWRIALSIVEPCPETPISSQAYSCLCIDRLPVRGKLFLLPV